MRTLSLSIKIALLLLAVAGCGEPKVVESNQLLDRDGLKYELDSGKPFTGVAMEHWPNGQKKVRVKYREGRLQGKLEGWYQNGQKMIEGEYRDGVTIRYQEWDREGNRTESRMWDEPGFPVK